MVLLIVKQETTRMGLNYISKSIFANSFENGWNHRKTTDELKHTEGSAWRKTFITWNVKT